MKQINISGVIGWDVEPAAIRQALADAKGEDVELVINSPGGFVSDGIEIFNMIRNYSGHTTARLSGFAMSMASYIPLAANKIIAEDNAVYMIHNVRGGVFGDHNEVIKEGETMRSLSRLLARAYEKRTGKSEKEVTAMMDAETFFFGADMVDHGFIDSIIETPAEKDKESAVALAYSNYRACHAKMSADATAQKADMSRAAAIFTASHGTHPTKRKEMTMNLTLEELRVSHPEMVAAIEATAKVGMITADDLTAQLTAAREEGAQNERDRIAAVKAQLIPGHEALIAQLCADGKSTAADAALAIVAAEQTAKAAALAAITTGSNVAVETVEGAQGSRTMTLKEFNTLDPQARRAFHKEGGKIID